jgi:hypothetical protein
MADVAAPLSRFVGRRAELADLQAVLQTHRLVTLLGTGGIGKTRLALEIARAWRQVVADVLVVDFATLHTGDLVDGALLEAAVSARSPAVPHWMQLSITWRTCRRSLYSTPASTSCHRLRKSPSAWCVTAMRCAC